MNPKQGTNFGGSTNINADGVEVWFRSNTGLVLYGTFTGSPSFSAGEYAAGCNLIKLDEPNGFDAWQFNNGTIASPTFIQPFD